MPRGTTPKAEGKASTRHRPTLEQVTLGTAPVAKRGKVGESPEAPAPGAKWSRAEWRELHKRTREWWLTWLEAPQASQFVATDWLRLFMIAAPLVERFNLAVDAGDVKVMNDLAGRIIQLEKEFGATPEARIRNRWVVRRPGDTPETSTSSEAPAARKVERDPRRLELVKEAKG